MWILQLYFIHWSDILKVTDGVKSFSYFKNVTSVTLRTLLQLLEESSVTLRMLLQLLKVSSVTFLKKMDPYYLSHGPFNHTSFIGQVFLR